MTEKILTIFLLFCVLSHQETGRETSRPPLRRPPFNRKKCDPECVFEATRLDSKSSSFFPTNCTKICSELVIDEKTDLTEEQLTLIFENLTSFVGGISISHTTLTSLKFLAGLEEIDCGFRQKFEVSNNNKMTELGFSNLVNFSCPAFDVSDNPKMTKLTMPNFKNYTSGLLMDSSTISMTNLASDFCITGDELKAFIAFETPDSMDINAKLCVPTGSKFCSKLAQGCMDFYGDLKIGQNTNMSDVKSIESIFGGLVINGTSLTNFDSFENLKYIGQLDEKKPAILIEANKNLTRFSFQNLKRIFANSVEPIVLKDNNKDPHLSDRSLCFALRDTVVQSNSDSLNFDGKTCEDMKAASTSTVAPIPTTTHISIETTVTPVSITQATTIPTTTEKSGFKFLDFGSFGVLCLALAFPQI